MRMRLRLSRRAKKFKKIEKREKYEENQKMLITPALVEFNECLRLNNSQVRCIISILSPEMELC